MNDPTTAPEDLLDDVAYWSKLARTAAHNRDKAIRTAKEAGVRTEAIAEVAGYASRGAVWRRIQRAIEAATQ